MHKECDISYCGIKFQDNDNDNKDNNNDNDNKDKDNKYVDKVDSKNNCNNA